MPEIRIHFQGISFRTGAGQMRYSHRLLGHDPAEQWSAFTAANTVAYNAVPVGEYRFEVRTVDRDGLLSEVASVGFRSSLTPKPNASTPLKAYCERATTSCIARVGLCAK